MNKTALIFGITGQDGSYLADFLLQKDYEVFGVARRSSVDTSGRLCSAKKCELFNLVEGDVTDAIGVYRLISEVIPDEIYNLAAQSHVRTSFVEPSHTFDVTAKGCLNILEAIRSIKADGHYYVGATKDYPRFYQASSSEMFGSSYSLKWTEKPIQHYDVSKSPLEGLYAETAFQNEDTPFRPNSPYAVAKLAAHNFVRLYREAYGIHASSGILFNHESPRRGDNFVTRKISLWMAGLFAHVRKNYPTGSDMNAAIRHAITNCYPRLRLGNIDAYRDWGFAGDYVEAMWLMLQQPAGDDYVVATGETHTVREFVEEALRVIGANELRVGDVVKHDSQLLRASEVPYLRGDATKAHKKLGWRPTTSFSELVKLMVFSDVGLRLGNGKGCN